jgi:hypothetical protein
MYQKISLFLLIFLKKKSIGILSILKQKKQKKGLHDSDTASVLKRSNAERSQGFHAYAKGREHAVENEEN